MKRIYRKFEAPADTSQCLPIEQSPWHFMRNARIPLNQWELIIEFAKTINPKKAEILERDSVGSFANDEYLDISDSEIFEIISFMLELQAKLEVSEPILSLKDRVFDEIHDEFENEEYKRMLEAVIAVYRESLKLGEPVCAYND